MLPLGLRVQEKAEALIDKYMFSIGNMKCPKPRSIIAEPHQEHQKFHYHPSLLKHYGKKVAA